MHYPLSSPRRYCPRRYWALRSSQSIEFFNCPTAFDTLADIQALVKLGSTTIINVLV